MAGTIEGGRRAYATITARDPEHYRRIGALGGAAGVGTLKGFAANRERARLAGAKGGHNSRRTKGV